MTMEAKMKQALLLGYVRGMMRCMPNNAPKVATKIVQLVNEYVYQFKLTTKQKQKMSNHLQLLLEQGQSHEIERYLQALLSR